MSKNILIVPSNLIVPQPDRIPYIDFENNNIIKLRVLSGAAISFSSTSQTPILLIDPSNFLISVGNNINVKNYFGVNGTQVINGTDDWIGPTTNIEGAQGATGAVGFIGPQGSTGDPGFQGAQGSVSGGTQGAQGVNNTTPGPGGPQGAQGAQGFGTISGAQGFAGPPGFQGGAGNPGSPGGQGAQGAQGATPSDMRMKKNIRPIESSLDKVLKLRGVTFLWKTKKILPDYKTDIGFIAQEVAHVLPELVFKSSKENSYYQVKYNDVIAICLEAINEQSRLIDLKEERLERLENKAKEKGLI